MVPVSLGEGKNREGAARFDAPPANTLLPKRSGLMLLNAGSVRVASLRHVRVVARAGLADARDVVAARLLSDDAVCRTVLRQRHALIRANLEPGRAVLAPVLRVQQGRFNREELRRIGIVAGARLGRRQLVVVAALLSGGREVDRPGLAVCRRGP